MSEVINMLSATEDWRSIEPVNKGWSDDQKYRAIKRDGKTCLLRLTDASKYELKKREYSGMLYRV